MSDYKALCERLRHQSEEAYLAGYCDDADHLTEARVAIESLQKQLEEARGWLRGYSGHKPTCDLLKHMSGVRCTCGLEAALAADAGKP